LIGRVISAIGQCAGVMVNTPKGKFASAHDLRRSFGTRWAAKVKPITLQLLMRHKHIETTLGYYVDQDADDVAEQLWAGFSNQNLGKTPFGVGTSPESCESDSGPIGDETKKPLTSKGFRQRRALLYT